MSEPRHAELIVEGENDQHIISNLLWKMQIPNYRVQRNERSATAKAGIDDLLITVAGGRAELLQSISARIKAGDRSALGFVVDADQDGEHDAAIDRTWNAISDQLANAGLAPTESIGTSGWDRIDSRFGTRVGFWIMPNNEIAGAIEEFLHRLIDEHDTLIAFAGESTLKAKADYSAQFSVVDVAKAHLACWLAWQNQPGRPPGQAMIHDTFRLEHELARQFVGWVQRLLAPIE